MKQCKVLCLFSNRLILQLFWVLWPNLLCLWTTLCRDVGKDNSETCDKNDICTETEMGRVNLELNKYKQDDPQLIEILKKDYLIPPVKEGRQFSKNFTDNLNGQFGQPAYVDDLLGQRRNGFFIEAGAYDGEHISNTMFFEVYRNWTGILVEPNPEVFERMKKKKRNAWLFPNCLSTKKRPEVVDFDASALMGGIINEGHIKPGDIGFKEPPTWRSYHRRTIKMQCFPIYSVMLAVGNPAVDYFSLDIEGAEIPVLKTIPFKKVDIKLFGIEANHLGMVFPGEKKDLNRLMSDKGYDFKKTVKIDMFYMKYEKKRMTVKRASDAENESFHSIWRKLKMNPS